MRGPSFQERMPGNHCFGCGACNEDGLRLASHWREEVAVAAFEPAPYHVAGPKHFVNGGILATVLDCHGVCTALADAYRREAREIGSEPLLWYATASMNVRYLRPTPMGVQLRLEARVVEVGTKKTEVHATVSADGKVCAEADVVAVRVPPAWFEEA